MGAEAVDTDGAVADRQSVFSVENIVSPSIQGAIGLLNAEHFGIQVGIVAPFGVVFGEALPEDPRDESDPNDNQNFKVAGQGLGDISIHPKIRLLNISRLPVGLTVMPSLILPTGDDGVFLGEGQFIFQPTVIFDAELGPRRMVHAGINVGGRIRTGDDAVFADTDAFFPRTYLGMPAGTGHRIQVGNELTAGAAVSVAFSEKFRLVVEGNLQHALSGERVDENGTQDLGTGVEVLGAMKLYLARNSYFLLGGGYGVATSYAQAKPRAFIGFIFEPNIGDRDGDGYKDDVDVCPDDPEDFDDFEDKDGCPDPDNDRDGILDVNDLCPNDPETRNGVDDEDGCPDEAFNDRDGDGLRDAVDQCPDDPEDFDNHQDEDGCPDPDNDLDGILDVDDLCPDDPEDKDGFEDADGCPDPDNDRDRILDVDDSCPNDPETYNGHEDEDGCPDKGKVVVRQGKLEILDKIYFETNKDVIKEVSFPLLDAIAATLLGNPQLQVVEIQGHADERSSAAYNLDLTERRAQAVRLALEDRGVEPERLRARGMASHSPSVASTTSVVGARTGGSSLLSSNARIR